MAVKRLREEEEEEETMVDRLSDMPESLQLHVLSFLDARHAVQTSVLSKSWVSSWTRVPVLNFCSHGNQQLNVSDNFVIDALTRREPVKLDRLTFKRDGECSAKSLQKVFDYAVLHGVEEQDVTIQWALYNYYYSWIWPMMFNNLLMMFSSLYAAKSLTVSVHIVDLLTWFPVNKCSPFRDLKCLKLDFSPHYLYVEMKLRLSEMLKLVPDVKSNKLRIQPEHACSGF